MAKFTATTPLNIKWNGLDISGAVGATHRIPDAYVEEFIDGPGRHIAGLTWVTQDELSAIPSLPIAQSSVSNLTSDLAGKLDKTGGTISGNLTVTGTVLGSEIGGVIYADRYSSLAAALTAGSGGTIYVPDGTYAITSALSIPSNTRLIGAGMGTKITQSANTPIIQVAASASAVEIEGFWLVGSATSASTASFGVHVQSGCANVKVRNVLVDTCYRSIEVVQASDVLIEACRVVGDVSDLGAIDVNQGTSILVRDCAIVSPRTHGVDFRQTSVRCQATGCEVTSPGSTGFVISTNCDRCSFVGCVSSGGQHGVVIEIGSNHSIIANNAFSAPSTNGILVSAAGSTHPAFSLIRGNAIRSTGSRGIWNSGGDHSVIEGNAIYGFDLDGIKANGSNSFAVISANTISGGTSSSGNGIIVESSADDCVITGNVVRDVAGRGIYANSLRASIVGNTVVDADNGGVATIGGITLSGSASWSIVNGNVSRRSTGTKQDYGVVVQSGCSNAIVRDNILYENTTGGVSDSGTGTVVSGNVVAASVGTIASYTRTAGDYTTVSTSFVDVDATNLNLTVNTQGGTRVEVGIIGTTSNTAAAINSFTVALDGVDLGGATGGYVRVQVAANATGNASFTLLTDVLAAGSHAFKLRWRASAGEAKLLGSTTHLVMWAREVPLVA